MKTTCRLALLFAAVSCLGVPLTAQSPRIIEPKIERSQGPPLWISAEAVADAENMVDLDRLGSRVLSRNVEKQRQFWGDRIELGKILLQGRKPHIAAIPRCTCASEFAVTHRQDNPSDTLDDLLTHSRSILRGTIRSIAWGFSFGVPSSLLELEISETVQGLAPRAPVYLDYPVAHFRIGPFSFCNLNQGFEPRPGDEVLLFDYKGPVDREDVFYVPGLRNIAFQDRDGALILPPQLKDDPDLEGVRTLDDMVDLLVAPGTWSSSIGRATPPN